jgi:hypothetical protein
MADDKWLTKANIINVGTMLVGTVLAIFGVAAASPAGQRILCSASGFFCQDVEPLDLVVTGEAIDFDAWCNEFVATLQALPELDRPPGVGAIPSAADCATTLDSEDATSFTRPLGVLAEGSNDYLALVLSFQHGAIREPVPFTVRTLCGYSAAGARQWTAIPCTLTTDLTVGNKLDYYTVTGPLPSAIVEAVLIPHQLYFSETWRLDLNNGPTAANLPRGSYQVNLRIATDAESVKEASARVEFVVD